MSLPSLVFELAEFVEVNPGTAVDDLPEHLRGDALRYAEHTRIVEVKKTSVQAPPIPPHRGLRYVAGPTKLSLSPLGEVELSKARMERQAESTRVKRGRPKKTESCSKTLVVAALATHHGYETGGSLSNNDPASLEVLAAMAGVSRQTVSDVLVSLLGKPGYKRYTAACARRGRGRIGLLIAEWSGELPECDADLIAEEYGRDRHE